MKLTPREEDRLLLNVAARLAADRRARGLPLNAPEAIALIADAVCEAAREGRPLEQALERGRGVVAREDLMEGVAALVPRVEVEALFPDGSRLVVVEAPFGEPEEGSPGAVSVAQPALDRAPAAVVDVAVRNTAAVPIGVTSHWHFFEANRALDFDRQAAWGMHLALPAGATALWEPDEQRTVPLRPFAGRRVVFGFAGLVNGPLDAAGARERALVEARRRGYKGADA
jgi:urease subunit gamma/beta